MSRPLRSIAEWDRDRQRDETDRAKRLRSSRIPERYWGATWEDYREGAGTADEELRDILTDYAEHWEPAERMGLVLLGPPGHGKTLGMATLAVELATERGAWVKWTTEHDLAEERKALVKASRLADESGDYEAYNRAAYSLAFVESECDVLLLDDVGKAYRAASDFANTELDALLRRRVQAGKVTCVSSNVAHEDWSSFDPSMASFLYEVGEIVNVTRGTDFRRAARPASKRRRAGR